MDTIRIALDWALNPNHIGIVRAARHGYFTAANVEAIIVPAERDRGVVEIVLAGEADLGVAFAGTVIEGRTTGQSLISVAAVSARHDSSLAVLASSNITRPADLVGNRYASFGHPALERAIITAMMRNDSATHPTLDLRTVRFADVAGLVRDDFDALWIYDAIEGEEARSNGIALCHFSPHDYGIPNYAAPVLFTSEDLRTDPDRVDIVRRALAAIARGSTEALAHPTGAMADLIAPPSEWGQPLFTDPDLILASLRRISRATPRVTPWGAQRVADWQPLLDLLWRSDAISPLDATTCFTNDLLA